MAICCTAAELKQKTVEAFDHYIRVTDARIEAELRNDGPFLWVDSLPQRQRLWEYDGLQRGELEIRQLRTEEEGKPIEVPDGLIHHWTGVALATAGTRATAAQKGANQVTVVAKTRKIL